MDPHDNLPDEEEGPSPGSDDKTFDLGNPNSSNRTDRVMDSATLLN